MRRSFTLIELIFVIVIIGVLSSVAIPKFIHLKQNAEIVNLLKQTVDAAREAAETGMNWRNLEGKVWDPHCNNIYYPDNPRWKNNFCLKNLVNLNGAKWRYDMTTEAEYYSYPNLRYYIALIELNKNNVIYEINCSRITDEVEKNKCIEFLGGKTNTKVTIQW